LLALSLMVTSSRTEGVAAPPAEAPLVLIGREGRRRVVLAADAAQPDTKDFKRLLSLAARAAP